MLTLIPAVLSADQIIAIRADLAAADWTDGRVTAGAQSAAVKANEQLPVDALLAQQWGARILDALGRSPRFVSAALPHRTLPPQFNRYQNGGHFGVHIDNAIRPVAGIKLRTDLAATLFLADPDSYDGGELTIETSFGAQRVKLPAGDMVLYPASSLHRVEPVTRGVRLASFFWVQSMVRDDAARALLFDLDQTIQGLGATLGSNDRHVVALTGTYHNLIRRWAET
ncbi:MAG: Fe2+-dependent dioxygenase [Polymorphobacter sp.]